VSTTQTPTFAPVPIGENADPPLAVLPSPETLFSSRAARFRVLAQDHQLAPYLVLMAGLADAQAAILPGLPPVVLPDPEALDLAFAHGMAPIARTAMPVDAAMNATLDALFDAAAALAMPEQAKAALAGVVAASDDERRVMIGNVVSDAIPAHEMVEHVLVAAGLQVHFARLAAALPAGRVTSVADGACPACGGPPVSSQVVGWIGSSSTRFCACGTCATLWHVVRVKCVACSSTGGISYLHVEGAADTIKAECCSQCGTYLKLMAADRDPSLDPVADDVASAGLDLLVREKGLRRSGFNVFLAGF
jgi:FdhE protein